MKKVVLALLALTLFAGCASKAQNAADLSALTDRQWKLSWIKTATSATAIDRAQLAKDNGATYFTIQFGENRISGKGAPNTYTAECKYGENRRLFISPIASTKMIALKEPKELNEHEFFRYLGYASEWRVSSNTLELLTPDASLIFTAE
ncbi:hypothetical protein FACS189487_01240 [Campylobacterota bacterium]|nr:hypothetical protein FACS189487_01240 [Campylobacterota bacterium]